MTLELLVCGDYCPITGLKIVGYNDKAKTEKQLAHTRERQRRNYTTQKRRERYTKKEKVASNIPT